MGKGKRCLKVEGPRQAFTTKPESVRWGPESDREGEKKRTISNKKGRGEEREMRSRGN